MAALQLTSSQRSALEAFKRFLRGPEQVFMLKGAAGTGKTTLVMLMWFNELYDSRVRGLHV